MIDRKLFTAAVLAAALGTSCGNSSSSTTAPSTPGPATETFTSRLPSGGSASRTFTAPQAGTINITLTTAGPPSSLVVGLGVGIPAGSVACSLSLSTSTAAGPAAQITTHADAGSYCVEIYDLGTITDPVSFTIAIDHP